MSQAATYTTRRTMIHISEKITINKNALQWDFIRSSGPGGQNVNKTATAAQLRFYIDNEPSIPEYVRKNLIAIADKRITNKNVLIITARNFRTQEQNRKDAINRLINIIKKASEKKKLRHKTKPTLGSKKRRQKTKQIRSKRKQERTTFKPYED